MTEEHGESLSAAATRAPSRLSSQRLLVTMLADYNFALAGAVPSAAIVELLGEFGISSAGARVALSRVAKSGMLVQSRSGRKTAYSLSEHGHEAREKRLKGYLDFGAVDREWDGRWTIVVFSIPEEDKGLRPRFRRELERLRFAPLTDAVWLQPNDCGREIASAGAEVGVGLAVVRAEFQHTEYSRLSPVDAFDLPAVRARYEEYLDEFGPWVERMRAGQIAPNHALVLRTNVLASWSEIARTDPDLPAELLPEDWPRTRTRELFFELWEGLGQIALHRLREIVGRHDNGAAQRLSVRIR
ncbi:PaaX family transcriptional regulator C-terminal domain-containing protein [Salinibacterium sp. GXW1014]|uniref:PaaX family transcriptional regulator n=1 Tax=Salinibacterium sp. GXW1014 TaxID=3377838 RepID=UPI00383B0D5E